MTGDSDVMIHPNFAINVCTVPPIMPGTTWTSDTINCFPYWSIYPVYPQTVYPQAVPCGCHGCVGCLAKWVAAFQTTAAPAVEAKPTLPGPAVADDFVTKAKARIAEIQKRLDETTALTAERDRLQRMVDASAT